MQNQVVTCAYDIVRITIVVKLREVCIEGFIEDIITLYIMGL